MLRTPVDRKCGYLGNSPTKAYELSPSDGSTSERIANCTEFYDFIKPNMISEIGRRHRPESGLNFIFGGVAGSPTVFADPHGKATPKGGSAPCSRIWVYIGK